MKLNYQVDGEQMSLAGEASGAVKKVLKQLGLPTAVIRKVSVAMYEAEINMVIHANGGQVFVEITPENIQIKLEDEGPGIPDIDLAMQEGYTTASDQAREMGFGAGMGLPNMKRYSDHLKVSSKVGKGTTVDLSFEL